MANLKAYSALDMLDNGISDGRVTIATATAIRIEASGRSAVYSGHFS